MWLLIGDTHFTDNARDRHRFQIFNWIRLQQRKYKPAATFLAGDLCDAKDRHSATLVNQVVAGLTSLEPPIYIDRGNHDYRDPTNPFFNFLNHIEGLEFVTEPKAVWHGLRMGIIPHYRTQDEFDDASKRLVSSSDAFLVHQTFEGAIAETGARLNGLSASLVRSFDLPLGVIAGDVHMPQTAPPVTYLGCPYHVRFGDDYSPRCLLINSEGKQSNLYFDAPYKWSLRINDAFDIEKHERLHAGDQIKLVVELTREEAVDWKQIKANVLAACKERQLEVYGIKMEVLASAKRNIKKVAHAQTKMEVFKQFANAEGLSKAVQDAGRKLIGE